MVIVVHLGPMVNHKGTMYAKRNREIERWPHHERVPWWRSPAVVLAAACLGLIALFTCLAAAVVHGETRPFDRAVRDWVFAHRAPWSVSVARGVTLLGDPITLIVLAGIAALALARAGARVRPLLIAALPFCVSITTTALRNQFQIPGPPSRLVSPIAIGFPSGHTLGSTALAIVVGYVLARERVGGQGARLLGWMIALVVPLAVAISRLYLDMHWASDVIGGWLIGAAYACAVIALYGQALRRVRSNAARDR
jgi:membrane-associated phospholipid phosphatase